VHLHVKKLVYIIVVEERSVGAGGYQFSAHSVRRWTRCLGGLLGPLSGTQTKFKIYRIDIFKTNYESQGLKATYALFKCTFSAF